MQQDFNALLNKLTTPDKPVKNAKAGPRVIQGIGAGNHDDRRSGRCPARARSIAAGRRPPARPTPSDLIVDFDLASIPTARWAGCR